MSAPRTLTVPSTLHVTLAGATLTSVLVFVYVYEIYLVISVWTLASKANWLHITQDGKFENLNLISLSLHFLLGHCICTHLGIGEVCSRVLLIPRIPQIFL